MKRAPSLQVKDAVNKGGIECHEEADRRHNDLEWSDKILARQGTECNIPFFVLRMKRPVSGFVSELACFVDEQYAGVRFI